MNNTTDIDQVNVQKPELRGYKSVCAKLGLSMCAYFTCRLLAGLFGGYLLDAAGEMNKSLLALLYYFFVIMMTYVIPLGFTVIIFKYNPPLRELYKKPKRVARALGTFPAAYGLGYGVALITLLISFILARTLGGDTYIEQLLRPTTIEASSNMTELVLMVVLMVVAAPLFEEYWARGIMFDALKPYGAGMAIIISSLLFGLMHGSLYMLFYTIALGLALGYIRYATGSLFIVTILHAMVNSISSAMLFLQGLGRITQGQNRVLNTIEMIFIVAVLSLIIIGVIVFFAKIPTIRKYRFENPWTEIGPWKKMGMFLVSIPVIISMVLAFNEITGHFLIDLFMG